MVKQAVGLFTLSDSSEQDCILGYCWCRLTDIEGEFNGIYTYDLCPKFDLACLRAIFAALAAIEQRKSCESC